MIFLLQVVNSYEIRNKLKNCTKIVSSVMSKEGKQPKQILTQSFLNIEGSDPCKEIISNLPYVQ